MAILKTSFEQVPVALVKKLAEKDQAPVPSRLTTPCAICSKPVRLELCKTNENGNAVHDTCYVAEMIQKKDCRRLATR